MTPEEGYHLAAFQRPGIKIVMGATEAREERVAPHPLLYGKVYGDTGTPTPVMTSATSWFEYDCARLIGKTRLSLWTTVFLALLAFFAGRAPTADEVRFFDAPKTSLVNAHAYLAGLMNA